MSRETCLSIPVSSESTPNRLAYKCKSLPYLGLDATSVVEKKIFGGYRLGVATSRAPLDRAAFGVNFERLFVLLRKSDGISARELARDLGVGEDRVSKWRKGGLPVPDTKTLLRMAVRFRVSVDHLLVGVDSGYDGLVGTLVPERSVSDNTKVVHLSLVNETKSPLATSAARNTQAHPVEGSAHGAKPEAGTTTTRRAKGERAIIDLRREEILSTLDRIKGVRDWLYQTAERARAIADTLHSGDDAPAGPEDGPALDRGVSGVDARHTRRRS